MLTSAECRQRAEQKITEAELNPRHERRLRTAAEGWLILADLVGRLEVSVGAPARSSKEPHGPDRI
jgi:hypothetical protein